MARRSKRIRYNLSSWTKIRRKYYRNRRTIRKILIILIALFLAYQVLIYYEGNTSELNDYANNFVQGIITTLDPGSRENIKKAFIKMNGVRGENGKPPLVWKENIYQLATFQASKGLCSTSHCSHLDSKGKYVDDYAHLYGLSLYDGIGENIAGSSCSEAIGLWLHSTTGHREIMLDQTMKYGALAYDQGNCILIVTR